LEGVVGTGWSWLRIGRLAGTCEYGKELSGCIKMREISLRPAKTGHLLKKDSDPGSK
jgi:hypothetical protein